MGLQGLINEAYAATPPAETSESSTTIYELGDSKGESSSEQSGLRRTGRTTKDGRLNRNASGGVGGGGGGDFGVETLRALEPPIISTDTFEQRPQRREKWAYVDLGGPSKPERRLPAIIIESEGEEERLGIEKGSGPGTSGDQYTRIHENPFIVAAGEAAVSTFSIDVDTASYANVRQFLMQAGRLPPPDAVRIEELINYFDYNYSGPTGEVPFASHVEVAACPWHPEHRLVRIGIKGRDIQRESRPQSNLVFLIDVSGSMNNPAKLPLLVSGMKLLTRELGENDRVAIVVYASSEGLALPSTRGDKQDTILAALGNLRAGGSTAGGAGIQLAYQVAQDHFIEGGVNRVILATDGDFNVGTTSTAELERMAEAKAKETGIFLTVLGFGRGNLNDAMMEAISGKGNGNYHYVDNQTEARKVLVEEMVGTLITIAKDVKIQVEFNPAQVAGYRLIGYENRMLRTEDFNDDKKDAGEIGAGHTVTALYEIVPAGKSVDAGSVDPLKYQPGEKPASAGLANEKSGPASDELLTLKIRYKKPDGDKSTKLEFPINDNGNSFAEATPDFKFAAAVASFGMLLRNSEHRGETSYDAVLEIAESVVYMPVSGREPDPHGYRAEFLKLVQQAKNLAGE
ncbi:MAG: VWA domain-containing protein [Planctomycetes bacterium]|nr:VWA domain-containing protein [Planctomycetota bacterium]